MIMYAKTGKIIFDPYDWLPGFGENSVSFSSHGLDVTLDIEYDADEPDLGEYGRRKIIFKSVCAFCSTAFPGIGILDIEYSPEDKDLPSGALIEFTDSELARKWEGESSRQRKVKHYRICFLSENIRFEIFAEDIVLSEQEFFNK